VESLGSRTLPRTAPDGFTRPYVISWNLTYRCNLACEHCYLDAGGKPEVRAEAFADRSELGTEECLRLVDGARCGSWWARTA
jgi:MoaA/NifB/PqqE/SkfB family radical SAM enzyme